MKLANSIFWWFAKWSCPFWVGAMLEGDLTDWRWWISITIFAVLLVWHDHAVVRESASQVPYESNSRETPGVSKPNKSV